MDPLITTNKMTSSSPSLSSSPSSSGPPPTLPTEIIYDIIDLIAGSASVTVNSESDLPMRCVRKQTLCALSRTASALHFYARRQLFAHVHFQFSSNEGSERDRALWRFLMQPGNRYLQRWIRALTITLGPLSSPTGISNTAVASASDSTSNSSSGGTIAGSTPQRTTAWLQSIGRTDRAWPDFTTSVLAFCLTRLTRLRAVTLAGHLERHPDTGVPVFFDPVDWQALVRQIPGLVALRSVVAKPTVRCLTMRDIRALPFEFLTAGPPTLDLNHDINAHADEHSHSHGGSGLRKLVADRVTFQDPCWEDYLQNTHITHEQWENYMSHRLASVKELYFDCRLERFSIIWPFPEHARSFGSTLYPCLTKVAIGITDHPEYTRDPNCFFQFLLSAAQTLEFIEIIYSAFMPEATDPLNITLSPDYLDNFPVLRHIGYIVKSWHTTSDRQLLVPTLNIFSNILSTRQIPSTTLSSISLEVHFATYRRATWDPFHLDLPTTPPEHDNDAPSSGMWSQLDDALCNPSFTNLQRLHCVMKFFVAPPGSAWMGGSAVLGGVAVRQLEVFLPKTCRLPFAEVEVYYRSLLRSIDEWRAEPAETEQFEGY